MLESEKTNWSEWMNMARVGAVGQVIVDNWADRWVQCFLVQLVWSWVAVLANMKYLWSTVTYIHTRLQQTTTKSAEANYIQLKKIKRKLSLLVSPTTTRPPVRSQCWVLGITIGCDLTRSTFVIVWCVYAKAMQYMQYIAWPLHTHTTHTLDTFGHLHINSCYNERGQSRIMSYSYIKRKLRMYVSKWPLGIEITLPTIPIGEHSK